jgi:endonuclease-8
MPEGDTIHKLAARMSPALVGQRLCDARLHGRPVDALSGSPILAVTSRGKHIIIDVECGLSLRVHLGMYGSWHRYPIGRPWDKPMRQATLVLTLAEQHFVCFNAKEVEILKTGGFRMRDQTSRLGPDLTRHPPVVDALLGRARELLSAETEVTDMLLDQRIASGIGNIYKSELLFLERCDPRTPFGHLSEESFAALYERAGRLLMSNLESGPRVTRNANDGRGILWVYGRSGRPCFRCGTGIVRDLLGRHLRPTYWCPSCQTA